MSEQELGDRRERFWNAWAAWAADRGLALRLHGFDEIRAGRLRGRRWIASVHQHPALPAIHCVVVDGDEVVWDTDPTDVTVYQRPAFSSLSDALE